MPISVVEAVALVAIALGGTAWFFRFRQGVDGFAQFIPVGALVVAWVLALVLLPSPDGG